RPLISRRNMPIALLMGLNLTIDRELRSSLHWRVLVAVVLWASSGQAIAGDSEKSTYTSYLRADAGSVFDKSYVVQGADFGTAESFTVGSFSGKNKTLNFALHYDGTSTRFAFINSSVDTNWSDAT